MEGKKREESIDPKALIGPYSNIQYQNIFFFLNYHSIVSLNYYNHYLKFKFHSVNSKFFKHGLDIPQSYRG